MFDNLLSFFDAWSQNVLTHGQQKESQCNRSDDRGTDGKEHLHRVEEEEHHQERNRSSQRKTQGLHRV